MSYSSISKIAAGIVLAGTLAACGSSSDEVTSTAAPAAPTTFTVAGTAATGAVFANATITIVDADSASYPAAGQSAVVTGADGSYTITLPLTAKPPFVVQAARDDKTLVSVVAEAKDTTTNITPVTHLIASRLSSSGDPAKLADEIKNKKVTVDAAAVKAKVAEVVALIKPLMDAVGDSTDPLNGKLVADGTGADKVLDSLAISITPSSATSVNIEVAVKQKLAEGVDPTVISFTNATTPAAALPTVAAPDLVASGTAAADVIAPACKDLFVGNDPASFKHNGATVSKTSAWSSLFGTGSGQKFDRGSYEFTRANGDLVIAYRATDSSGNSNNNILVVKADTDGKLRAIGNQYRFNGSVNAYHQRRTFINQPAADYYSTGYSLFVNNTVNASGNPIFAKVVVTSPKGNVLTLKPTAGSAYLGLVKTNGTTGAETVTGTSIVRIRAVYIDAANSAKNPAAADTGNFFATKPSTDAEIAAFAAQSTWKFEYYLASAPTTVAATQYFKTRARAMTIAELQTQPLAALTDANISDIKTNTVTTSTGAKYLPTPATGPVTMHWTVPTGALAPTSLQVYGNGGSFNDKATVASTARTGDVACSAASTSDTHCSSGNYAAGGRLVGAHLWANDALGREFASFYAFYTVTIQ